MVCDARPRCPSTGQQATHLFIITAGEVALVSHLRGGERVHRIIGPGQMFGELGLLSTGRQSTGARATKPSTIWVIGRDAFWEFLDATPAAQSALMREVVKLLADQDSLIDDLLSLDVKGRLAKALLGLGERYGRLHRSG
jgi:CRP/FNR family transcriptional regulator, cyclic AMP receptor protein